MTRQAIKEWIESLPLGSFSYGATRGFFGLFDESVCAPAGRVDESDYCEGGREVLVRLRQVERTAPASRMQHGETMEVGN